MPSVRVVLDTTQTDETASTFMEALSYSLHADMPHDSFTFAALETGKLKEVGQEFRAASLRAIAECEAHKADECLHVTPLEVTGSDPEVMLLALVAAEHGHVFGVSLFSYCYGDVPDELDKALEACANHARTTLIKHSIPRDRDERAERLFHAVSKAYKLACRMNAPSNGVQSVTESDGESTRPN